MCPILQKTIIIEVEFHLFGTQVGKIAQSILLLTIIAARPGGTLIPAAKTAQQVETEQVRQTSSSYLLDI